MTRIDKICQAAQNYSDSMDEFQRYHTYPRSAFIDGAKWADKNPQHSKEEFIKKACKWLSDNKDNYIIDIEGEILIDDQIIKNFCKAMEE